MGEDLSTFIKFGTDGWRGIIGFDFNFNNLKKVVVASCQELKYQFSETVQTNKILIGYDRRFMAEEFAKSIIPFIKACDLEPILSNEFVTTPACSLYVKDFNFLGALIITASHNPYNWLGLKIKSFKGCSVNESFTKNVEQRLKLGNITTPIGGKYTKIDIKKYHLEKIKLSFNTEFISNKLKKMRLKVFVDSMHGSASQILNVIFGEGASDFLSSIRNNRDPYFDGNPPEPLEDYLEKLRNILKHESKDGIKTLGIIFDGDGDRISVIDENGRYCSSQILLPYFIDYLGRKNKNSYSVIKTVSGSDIIKNISEQQNRQVYELPVGFKFISEKMLSEQIFIGGEESGGIAFGEFLPERDALFAAMVLLNGIAEESNYLCNSLDKIQQEFGPSFYDRVDISFPNNSQKKILKDFILKNHPKEICSFPVKDISMVDGIKFRIDKNYWILFRFSGTEPLLRIYCEATSKDLLEKTLLWSQNFVSKLVA